MAQENPMESSDVTVIVQLFADLCLGGLAYSAVKDLRKIVDAVEKRLDNVDRRLEELEK